MIIVSDPAPLIHAVRESYLGQGAKEGDDFGKRELLRGGALSLIAGTPIAYLPDELMKASSWVSGTPIASLHDFTPKGIQAQLGDGLKMASIFAARAHAMFDVATKDAGAATTRDVYRSPLGPLILQELLSVSRHFDDEHPSSAQLLNQASDEIAKFVASQLSPMASLLGTRSLGLPVPILPLVEEVASENIDHIQAADVAAGLAREILEVSDVETLIKKFEGVIVNGEILRRPR